MCTVDFYNTDSGVTEQIGMSLPSWRIHKKDIKKGQNSATYSDSENYRLTDKLQRLTNFQPLKDFTRQLFQQNAQIT